MKKAMIVVSFGTSYVETRKKTIEAVENRFREQFPEHDIFRAFTSNKVIKKIKEQEGLSIPTVNQLMPQLEAQGYREVYIQPLHVIPGSEYAKAQRQAFQYQGTFELVQMGKPLLNSFADYQVVTDWLKELSQNLAADEALVLMGHGSQHSAFTAYACLDHLLLETPVFVCAVESYPEITSVIGRLQAAGYQKIQLHPFMLVAGDHATNDMASDEEDSWKSQLEAAGFEVTPYLIGMGEYPVIQERFVQHMQILMEAGE